MTFAILSLAGTSKKATIFDYGLAEPTGSAMRVVSAGRRRSLLLGGERTRGDRPEPQAANLTVEA